MTLNQPPHHVGLAGGPERRADFLGLLHLDQPVDDVAALHQQGVDLLVDGIDLAPQLLQRRRGRRDRRGFGHSFVTWKTRATHEWKAGALIGKTAPESKENIGKMRH